MKNYFTTVFSALFLEQSYFF